MDTLLAPQGMQLQQQGVNWHSFSSKQESAANSKEWDPGVGHTAGAVRCTFRVASSVETPKFSHGPSKNFVIQRTAEILRSDAVLQLFQHFLGSTLLTGN